MNEPVWALRVTATDSETAQVVARRHQFVVGRPLHFDAQYPHVTALEYALGAVGAEIVNGLRGFAKRRRLALDDIEAVVQAELDNPLTYLEVIGETGHPGLSRLLVKVYIASPHGEQVWTELWQELRGRLPLVRTLSTASALSVEFNFTAG